MREYKNRYGGVFTFREDDRQDILWEGNFEYCRFGMPNDYTRAYDAYLKDNEHVQSLMPLQQFKEAVHEYDDETHQYIYDKYVRMVDSLKDEIEMVDPSGGPYISRGMPLDSFGFKKYVVKDFKRIDTGYKIITEKCAYCGLAGNKHKMGCETKKMTIYLNILILFLFVNVCSSQCYSYNYREEIKNSHDYVSYNNSGNVEFTSDHIIIDNTYYEVYSVQRLIKQEFFIYGCMNINTMDLIKIVTTDWDESEKYITMLFFENGLHHKYCLTKI